MTVTRDGVTRTLLLAPDGDACFDTDGRRVDATVLTTALRYAVPPAVTTTLCERHLGVPPEALAPPLSVRIRQSAGALSVATVLLAVAVAVVVVSGGPGPVPTTTDSSTTETAGSSRAPGLGAREVTDLSALSLAHTRALANQSYVLRYACRGPSTWGSGDTQVRREATATVAGDRFILSTRVGQNGTWTTNRTVYHDGSNWYVADHRSGAYRRVPEGVGALSFVGGPEELRQTLVPTYLSTPETRVNRNGDRYEVIGRGLAGGVNREGARNYTVRAEIDRDGVVRALTSEYLVPTETGPKAVVVAVSYDRVGSERITPPEWYTRFASENTSERAAR